MARILGIVFAVGLHGAFILFGGIFFPKSEEYDTLRTVDLVSTEEEEKEDETEPEEQKPEETEDLAEPEEDVPDPDEVVRNLEQQSSDEPPALDAASLSAIEQALSGEGSGGEFGAGLSFDSGGVLGGTGVRRDGERSDLDRAFDLDEIDQRARVTLQVAPMYPAELRGRKIEGVATLIFVVDASGKVTDPRVQQSTHPAFEKPALDAIRQWRFEPALRRGERVSSPARQSIRFQPN